MQNAHKDFTSSHVFYVYHKAKSIISSYQISLSHGAIRPCSLSFSAFAIAGQAYRSCSDHDTVIEIASGLRVHWNCTFKEAAAMLERLPWRASRSQRPRRRARRARFLGRTGRSSGRPVGACVPGVRGCSLWKKNWRVFNIREYSAVIRLRF